MFGETCGMNNTKICRICLKSSSSPIHIFGDHCIQNTRSIKDCLEEVCGISVSVEDSLPDCLCPKCTHQITECYEFRELAQKNNEFLHKILEGDYIDESKEFVQEYAIDLYSKSCEESVDNLEQNLYIDYIENCDDLCTESLKQTEACENEQDNVSDIIQRVSPDGDMNDENDVILEVVGEVDYTSPDIINSHENLSENNEEITHGLLKESSKKLLQKNFECDYCEAKFVYLRNKRQHEKRHRIEGNRACHLCERRFYTNYDLNRHLFAHTNEKHFKCDTCTKLFLTKSELNRHQRIHETVKKYKCNYCGKDFHELGVLNFHKKTVHLEQKKHQCKICGKFFSTPSKVRRHQKTRVCLQTKSVKTLHEEDGFIILDDSGCIPDSDSINVYDRKADSWITLIGDEDL